MQKVAIVIKLLMLISIQSYAQNDNYDLIGSIIRYIVTYNNDSVYRIYTKPLCPNWETILTEKTLFEKWEISENEVNQYITCVHSISLGEIIKRDDLTRMLKQIPLQKNQRWRTKLFQNDNIKVLKKRIKLSPHKNRKKIKDYLEVSPPVFSLNGQTAILQINQNCGMECGNGYIYIFHKENGVWIKLYQKLLWIS